MGESSQTNAFYKIIHLLTPFLPDFVAGRGLSTALDQLVDGTNSSMDNRIHSPNSFVKHALQVALRQSRTFQILMCANLLSDRQSLFVGDGLHLACAEGFRGRAIVSQIELGSHEDDGDIGGVVFDFREPLEGVR